MSAVLHISDTHFGLEVEPVVSALLALHTELQPELVVLSGDITQRARPYEFARASAFLERLAPRALLAVPGNHDLPFFRPWLRLTAPYARYKAAVQDDLAPVHASDDFLVLGVNTTRPQRLEDGEISPAQVESVAARLSEGPAGQLKIVVTHQPLAGPPTGRARGVIRSAAPALDAWVRAGARLFLGGHLHVPYVTELKAQMPTLSDQAWVAQAGTAVSYRLRERIPNSVNVIRGGAATPANVIRGGAATPADVIRAGSATPARVERWDYDAQAQRFCIHSTTWLT
jgi:3',5'-cyclic AMP phosphodiesterase CpdA